MANGRALSRGCVVAVALGSLVAGSQAPADDADTSRSVNQYVYKITAAKGTVTTRGHMQSDDGEFREDSAAKVAINGLRRTEFRQASFYPRRRTPQEGSSGNGTFYPKGPFSASRTSNFGSCSDGYNVQRHDVNVQMTFTTSGRKVFAGFSGNGGPERCGYEPTRVVQTGFTRRGNGRDLWTMAVPVPKRLFSKRTFTLKFRNTRTDAFQGPAGSGETTRSGTLNVSFKRVKTYYR